MSIVQTLYKPGAALTVADALSRIARNGEVIHNTGLPWFLKLLLAQLPASVRKLTNLRVNAKKNTVLEARVVQQWCEPN